MHFRIEHVFKGIGLDEYESLYFDEDFNIALCNEVRLARKVVANSRDDKKIDRRLIIGPDREVPGPVQKVLKTDRIEYEEHVKHTFGTYAGTWETIPNIMPSKVTSKGTYRFEACPGGVKRIVEGDISVKILGVGGVIEKFIVDDVKKSYEDAARFTQKWVDRHQAKTA